MFSLSLSLSLVGLLHGDMSQGDRDKVITTFKKKEFPILVATDVAGEPVTWSVTWPITQFPIFLSPSHSQRSRYPIHKDCYKLWCSQEHWHSCSSYRSYWSGGREGNSFYASDSKRCPICWAAGQKFGKLVYYHRSGNFRVKKFSYDNFLCKKIFVGTTPYCISVNSER